MIQTKANDIVVVRNVLREQGKEEMVMLKLSPATRETFKTVLPITWVDNKLEEEIMFTAAPVLFPEAARPMMQLGRLCADKNLSGIYKAFLSIPSPGFVIKRVPALWAMMSKQGKINAEMKNDQCALITLIQYSDLPGHLVEFIAGYAQKLVELMGYKKVGVKPFTQNPQAWQWEICWEK